MRRRHARSFLMSWLDTHHDQLALDILDPLQRIIILALTQAMAMNVRRKIAHGSRDTAVKGTAVGQVATQAHARSANTAVALRMRQ